MIDARKDATHYYFSANKCNGEYAGKTIKISDYKPAAENTTANVVIEQPIVEKKKRKRAE